MYTDELEYELELQHCGSGKEKNNFVAWTKQYFRLKLILHLLSKNKKNTKRDSTLTIIS